MKRCKIIIIDGGEFNPRFYNTQKRALFDSPQIRNPRRFTSRRFEQGTIKIMHGGSIRIIEVKTPVRVYLDIVQLDAVFVED
jgi:hypothetical protein